MKLRKLKKIPLEEIAVVNRQRQHYPNIPALALSIQSAGQMVPIVLEETPQDELPYRLIDGGRRIKAHEALGQPTILAVIADGSLNSVERMKAEFITNDERENLSWAEKTQATKMIHEAMQEECGKAVKGHGGGWGQRDTAELVKTSTTAVNQDLQLAKAIEEYPELSKCKSRDQALKHLFDIQHQQLTRELARRRAKTATVQGFWNCCGLKGMRDKIENNSVDLILTDPPYGIDFKASDQGGTTTTADYEDGNHQTMDMLANAARLMYQVLKDDRHLLMFCDFENMHPLIDILTDAGFNTSTAPIIWNKMSGSSAPTPYTFGRSYEILIHAMKGKRELKNVPLDLLSYKRVPYSLKIHASQKPIQLLQKLIEACSEPGELVLDPFAGSASTLQAALILNRSVAGFELNEVFYTKASIELETLQRSREKGEIDDTTTTPTPATKTSTSTEAREL